MIGLALRLLSLLPREKMTCPFGEKDSLDREMPRLVESGGLMVQNKEKYIFCRLLGREIGAWLRLTWFYAK